MRVHQFRLYFWTKFHVICGWPYLITKATLYQGTTWTHTCMVFLFSAYRQSYLKHSTCIKITIKKCMCEKVYIRMYLLSPESISRFRTSCNKTISNSPVDNLDPISSMRSFRSWAANGIGIPLKTQELRVPVKQHKGHFGSAKEKNLLTYSMVQVLVCGKRRCLTIALQAEKVFPCHLSKFNLCDLFLTV